MADTFYFFRTFVATFVEVFSANEGFYPKAHWILAKEPPVMPSSYVSVFLLPPSLMIPAPPPRLFR